MRTLLFLSALFIAAGARAAEVPVTPPLFGPASGNQFSPAIGSDGDRYLVVWTDQRAGLDEAYATRISSDGAVLDPHGIRLATERLTEEPHIVSNGSVWFVLSNDCSGVWLVRIDRDGTMLDAEPRKLPIQARCRTLSVATDGRRVVVGYVTQNQAHALFLGEDGSALADIHLSAGAFESSTPAPAIVWDGSSFVAVWDGHAARFDANGVRGPVREVLFLGGSAGPFAIASDGKDFVVVCGGLVYRMSADLTAEYAGPLPFTEVQSISWTGSAYVVAGGAPTANRNTLTLVRLDRDGRPIGAQTVHSSGIGAHSEFGLAAATNGRNVLAVWHDQSETPQVKQYPDIDIYGSILSLPSLAQEPREVLSFGGVWQVNPVVAANGTNQLTVWTEASGLMARRHYRDGGSDDAPIALTHAATSAAVAFKFPDYLVATTEGNSVVVRRVGAKGALRVLSESRLDQPFARYVALGSDGASALVGWATDGGIFASRVGADGSIVDAAAPLRVAPAALARNVRRIFVASNSLEYLVVWGGTVPGCNYCSPSYPGLPGPVRAARVTATLSLLDSTPIQIVTTIDGLDYPRSDPNSPRYDPLHTLTADDPSAAWNGSEWLVVWNRAYRDSDVTKAVIPQEIRGRRIARNGTLLDGTAAEPGVLIASDGYAPTVAYNAGYVVAWREGEPSYSFGLHGFQPIHVASFDQLGAALRDQRTLGESPQDEPPSVAIAFGSTYLAYARIADADRYGGVSRAFLQVPTLDARRRSIR